MAELVNLRRVRKAKAREDAEKSAAENRVRFGMSKTERKSSDAQNELEKRRLDGHQRLPTDESKI